MKRIFCPYCGRPLREGCGCEEALTEEYWEEFLEMKQAELEERSIYSEARWEQYGDALDLFENEFGYRYKG